MTSPGRRSALTILVGVGGLAMAFACSSGTAVLGDAGAEGGTSSGTTSSGTTSSGTTSSGTTSSGATTCAAAGGSCLSGIACKEGFYADEGKLSCPSMGSTGAANTPCCLPATGDAACQGQASSGTPPTTCATVTCQAGATHCEVTAGGPAGSGSTTACATSTECGACPTCACLLRTFRASECSNCRVDGGIATLSCAAP